jgi:flagellar biosynthesis/type III secretory pathway ATPase
LGAAGHYPAIDVLNSVSRLTSDIATPQQKDAMNKLRDAMATYRRTEDLINLGAYVAGANPKVDAAVRVRQGMEDFLKQTSDAKIGLPETLLRMADLAAQV